MKGDAFWGGPLTYRRVNTPWSSAEHIQRVEHRVQLHLLQGLELTQLLTTPLSVDHQVRWNNTHKLLNRPDIDHWDWKLYSKKFSPSTLGFFSFLFLEDLYCPSRISRNSLVFTIRWQLVERNPEPTLLPTQVIFKLPHHIVWEQLAFDDAVKVALSNDINFFSKLRPLLRFVPIYST